MCDDGGVCVLVCEVTDRFHPVIYYEVGYLASVTELDLRQQTHHLEAVHGLPLRSNSIRAHPGGRGGSRVVGVSGGSPFSTGVSMSRAMLTAS